jgi:RES domain-containing protein
MIAYRLVNALYKEDLSGLGSFLHGGRWNPKGLYALYGSEHISLAALEIVVNYNSAAYKIKPVFHLVKLELPDFSIVQIHAASLKKKWTEDFDYSQFMGEQFLRQKTHLTLIMPSAVIPEENNMMINPLHRDFKKVKIRDSKPYGFDNRLF